jgi:hypothetical protein
MSGEQFYLGLAVNRLERKQTIPRSIRRASGCSNTTSPARSRGSESPSSRRSA